MKRLIFSAIASVCFVVTKAATIQVPADYSTVQQGINNANNGDTVLIQPGTYLENINFLGKNIIVASLYLTTSDTAYISSTILSSSPLPGNNKSIVSFENNETSAAQLIGLTLQYGSGNYRQLGAEWIFYGGGVYCDHASPFLSHLQIINNQAECGGGVFLYYSDALIEHCKITGNTCNSLAFEAPNAGGAIAVWNCQNATVRNNKIQNNDVSYAGGACYSLISNLKMINCLVSNNHSGVMGAGFYADGWSNLNIINSTVTGNTCDSGPGLRLAGVLYCLDSAKININNTIFYNNQPVAIVCQFNYSQNEVSVSHSDFEGGMDSIITNNGGSNVTINWQSGNININPQFVNMGAGDFHLLNTSACINSGDTTGIFGIPFTDLDNNNRFNGLIDMGCYEFQGTTGINNMTEQLFFSVYPNPVSDYLIFDFSGKSIGGMIKLYNANGEIVHSQNTFFGQNSTKIPVSQLANGVYFLLFTDGKMTSTRKIVVTH